MAAGWIKGVMVIMIAILTAVDCRAEVTGRLLFERGMPGMRACADCHGKDGAGGNDGRYPKIGGQFDAYLAKQLEDFRSGARHSLVMTPIVGRLSPGQIRSLVAYVAALEPVPAPTAEGDALGRELATHGKWSAGVAPCDKCHGSGGAGVPPHFPALAGQRIGYTMWMFEAFRSGARRNDPLGLMQHVAKHLSESEVAAVARHYQAQGQGR